MYIYTYILIYIYIYIDTYIICIYNVGQFSGQGSFLALRLGTCSEKQPSGLFPIIIGRWLIF